MENLASSVTSCRATAAASAGSAPSAISFLRNSLRSFVTAFLSAASFFLSAFGSLTTFALGRVGAFRLVLVTPIRLLASFCSSGPLRCFSNAAVACLGVLPRILPSGSGLSVATYNPSSTFIVLVSPSLNVTVISPVSASG